MLFSSAFFLLLVHVCVCVCVCVLRFQININVVILLKWYKKPFFQIFFFFFKPTSILGISAPSKYYIIEWDFIHLTVATNFRAIC